MPPELAALDHALRSRQGELLLWWRDDDAGRGDPRLGELLRIAERTGAVPAIAVVPAWLQDSVAHQLNMAGVAILQHGWAHTDHARPGERSIELGGTVPHDALVRDLARGKEQLAAKFGPSFLPAMVPPWNRMDPAMDGLLAELGYRVVSALAEVGAPPSVPAKVRRRDVHVDCMTWRRAPRWRGLRAIVDHIAALAPRAGSRPLGIMTHHRVMTAAAFAELETLLSTLASHDKVRMLEPAALMPRT